jgi:hypothetical protein
MELTRTYYPFTATGTRPLEVSVTAGHPVQHGKTVLPFKADGELGVGDTPVRFEAPFVLNISGRSDIEVTPPEIEQPHIPDRREVPTEPYVVPSESAMRAGGVTAVEGEERTE